MSGRHAGPAHQERGGEGGGRVVRRRQRVQPGHRAVGGHAGEREVRAGEEADLAVLRRAGEGQREVLLRREGHAEVSGDGRRGDADRLGEPRGEPRGGEELGGAAEHAVPDRGAVHGRRVLQGPHDRTGHGDRGEGPVPGMARGELQELWNHAGDYHEQVAGGSPVRARVRRHWRHSALEVGAGDDGGR